MKTECMCNHGHHLAPQNLTKHPLAFCYVMSLDGMAASVALGAVVQGRAIQAAKPDKHRQTS